MDSLVVNDNVRGFKTDDENGFQNWFGSWKRWRRSQGMLSISLNKIVFPLK